jgi:uncharacterized phiE125 gp8 family phage protein
VTTFIEPPFWARGGSVGGALHMTSVLVVAPIFDVLTLDQGKLRAGLDWTIGDARDALMLGFIAAATAKVEHDTGLALRTQTRDVYFDARPTGAITLPALSTPLQSVTSIKSTDTADVVQTLDPAQYVVDLAGGRIGLALAGSWPTDLRPFQPFVARIVSGFTSAALIPPLLVHAVGLMTAHMATAGRDVAAVGNVSAVEMPYGYEDAIAPYRIVTVA